MSTLAQAEQRLRRLRTQAFDQRSPEDERRFVLSLTEAKSEVMRLRSEQPAAVGPYSGLTRAELHRSGTCETDWS